MPPYIVSIFATAALRARRPLGMLAAASRTPRGPASRNRREALDLPAIMPKRLAVLSLITVVCALLGCGGSAPKKGIAGTAPIEVRKDLPLRRLACNGSSDKAVDVNNDGYANVRHAFD